MIKQFLNDESGATAIEYGLIAAMFSVTIIALLGALRTSYQNLYSGIEAGVAGTV